MVTLKELVKGTIAEFQYYRNKYIYYNIKLDSGDTYQLVLDEDEFQGVDLDRDMKASLFMRWIRKALDDNTLVKVA
jgi:hypothetical protein